MTIVTCGTLRFNIEGRKGNALEEFLLTFIRKTHDSSVIQSIAKLLKILVGDEPILAVVPFRYHKHLVESCSAIKNGSEVKSNLQTMKEYGTHLSNTLSISITHGFGATCANFLEYLVDKV